MLHNQFDEYEPITVGINIDKWSFSNKDTNNFRINTWDFGGQEVNYPTHQFFLTKRSIYIKVWEHRQYSNLPNLAFFDYWLNVARMLGENSPILLVQNKIDERYQTLPQQELQEIFGVHRFFDVSAKDGTGIAELKQKIEQLAAELPHTGIEVPRSWFEVRNELASLTDNYISLQTFFDICDRHSIHRTDALELSDFFHDLGVILHFKHNVLLRDVVFLQFDWATQAVYRIMNHVKVQRAFGVFGYDILNEIWYDYPNEKYPHLLALMQKFQMCLPLENNQYLVPELLAADPPAYKWDFNGNVRFEFSYPFMPAGLMTQLVWRLFDMLEVYWKSGAVLVYKNTRLLVRIYIVERRISFWITGEKTEETLNFVRWEFDKIHRYLQSPPFKEMFPCNCHLCETNTNPEFYEYTELQDYLNDGIAEIRCRKSRKLVPIKPLIGKYNGGSPKTPLLEYIVRAAKKMQGLHKPLALGKDENNRNTFIANELSNADYIIKDQALWGSSATGIKAGELDIKIENRQGETISIIEAFNLDSLNKEKIIKHITKLFREYNTNGLPEMYIIVYSEANDFVALWEKYKVFVQTITVQHIEYNRFADISQKMYTPAQIKVAQTQYTLNQTECTLYHVFVNMNFTF